MTKLGVAILTAMTTTACTSPDAWKPAERDPGYTACRIDDIDASDGSDYVESRTFDDAGNATHQRFAWANGGLLWDASSEFDGDRITTWTVLDAHGATNEVRRWMYEPQRGDLVRFDDDGGDAGSFDGKIDFTELWTYGDADRLIRTDYDSNGDGTLDPDHYALFTEDAYGCLAKKDVFAPGARERITYTVNPACNITEADHDLGADGTIDGVETITYDTSNTLPIDYNALDGSRYHYTYDDHRRYAKVERWQAHLTVLETWQYTYDCTP